MDYQQVNHARYRRQIVGHYESYFLRANHPDRPLAFWIRYTIFSPKNRPADAIGELWAIFFDGETGRHVAVKQELPFDDCDFRTDRFAVRAQEALLEPGRLQGAIQVKGKSVRWDLTFTGNATPLLLLPSKLYETKFPAAKSLVSLPLARFDGRLFVNDRVISVDGWQGSQNHNWGVRHTDLYAWGQVAGFDNDPSAFLEIATARLRFGPVWSPPFTPIVLRYRDTEYAFRGLFQSLRAHGSFEYFAWRFRSSIDQVTVEGTITASRPAFVGLSYYNPPGGFKYCLNTKIAACTLHLQDKEQGRSETLVTNNRAAFEILTDDAASHGVKIEV